MCVTCVYPVCIHKTPLINMYSFPQNLLCMILLCNMDPVRHKSQPALSSSKRKHLQYMPETLFRFCKLISQTQFSFLLFSHPSGLLDDDLLTFPVWGFLLVSFAFSFEVQFLLKTSPNFLIYCCITFWETGQYICHLTQQFHLEEFISRNNKYST